MTRVIFAVVLFAVSPALADETFFSSPTGTYRGSAETLSNGDTSFYSASGAYQGSATMLGNGDAFFHSASGAYQGSAIHLDNGGD